ncbi:MAG: response regulator [Nitrospirae bacterium]|nr:MAG: response regulator [Nitrospirota bacterium]
MAKKLSILFIEDSEDDALLLVHRLKRGGYDIEMLRVETADSMTKALKEQSWDLIICDYSMPHFSAPAAINTLKKMDLDIPFIVMSGVMGEETAVEMMRAGAHDYIRKDNTVRLIPAIERELHEAGVRKERTRLSEQLQHAQRMESIGTLTGGIAHDFNNILTALIGYATLLKMKLREDDPLKKFAEQILFTSERAANLTRSLLAFSRKQVLAPKPANINEIIGSVQKLLTRIIGEDIELKVVLSDCDLIALVDIGQIEQVLINLCTNARDAMPEGGMLLIETSLVFVDEICRETYPLEKAGQYALITVTDTGTGMDGNTQKRIFEPFFTTKETGKGTGLGMAIAYGVIKQHNGSINVYSEPGKGTTFRIYLPIRESSEEEELRKPHQQAARGSETLLVAEDDSDVRTIIRSVLEDFGYGVIEADNGEDAVRIFAKNRDRINLALLDLIMPKKNGTEAYRELKMLDPNIKAIFMSGYTEDIIRQKGPIENGIEFINKPLIPEELLRKIRNMLDR